ncbi:hypothetical protein [Flavobacterium johnsoniae]|uniref:CHAP domain-containing protein n=1 Tax=Flavobacterium johnsoniae TaxID=986 RepID=A0A1M5WCA7_FLAJO|nr:hypothetical protein [Flavobacterium johnsoniae]SHH85080.1 hypothetical protein SAMN05444388_1303 [Flavobacterium johnsoniae]
MELVLIRFLKYFITKFRFHTRARRSRQQGDIFVWGYVKDGSWAGHTGVVYDYDETDDIVTILEAVGSHGAVSENDQVKNGGYSGKGCTRTAKYGRLKVLYMGTQAGMDIFAQKKSIKLYNYEKVNINYYCFLQSTA